MTALVTGAARGIGREYALQLSGRGYRLVLVDRDPSVEELCSLIPDSRAVICDLAREDAADIVFADTVEHCEKVDILINNAGEFSFCDVFNLSDEKIRSLLTLHEFTLTRLNRLFGKDMAGRGGGRILNMSSFSIWMPLPGLALYSASKAYIKAFSVAFSKEVREKGVYVTAICPAGVATDLYGLSPKFQRLGLRLGVLITPRTCARRALRALFRGRRCAVPDWWNRLFIPILIHLPSPLERIIREKTRKFQK